MLQESATTSWNLRVICYSGPSTKLILYVLFLAVACITTSFKMVRLWIAAPPFQLNRQAGNAAYLHRLEDARNSLKQWMAVTLVVGGIFTSLSVYDVCSRLLLQKTYGGTLLIAILGDFSTALTLCLVVVLFILLVRWYLIKRIEQLNKSFAFVVAQELLAILLRVEIEERVFPWHAV